MRPPIRIGQIYTYASGNACGEAYRVTSVQPDTFTGQHVETLELDTDVPNQWIGNIVRKLGDASSAKGYKQTKESKS